MKIRTSLRVKSVLQKQWHLLFLLVFKLKKGYLLQCADHHCLSTVELQLLIHVNRRHLCQFPADKLLCDAMSNCFEYISV